MNIPFSLALSAASPYGKIINPFGATVPTSVDNTILTGLSPAVQFAMDIFPPKSPFYITSFCAQGDTASQKVSLGLWDVTNSVFIDLYDIVATMSAGGGMVRPYASSESGIYMPQSAVLVPCFKLTSGSGLQLTGDLEIMPISFARFSNTAAGTAPDLGGPLTDDTGAILTDDATPGVPLTPDF